MVRAARPPAASRPITFDLWLQTYLSWHDYRTNHPSMLQYVSMFLFMFAINYSMLHSFASIPYVVRINQAIATVARFTTAFHNIFRHIVFVCNEELLSIQCGLCWAAEWGTPQSLSFDGSILQKNWDGDCATNGTAWTSPCQQIDCKYQIKPTYKKTIPVNSSQGGGEAGKEHLCQKFRIYLQ